MNSLRRFWVGIVVLVLLGAGGGGLWWFSNQPESLNLVVETVISVGKEPIRVAVSSDCSRVYVTNAFSATLSVIDTGTNQVIEEFAVAENARLFGIALSPDDKTAYISYTERTSESAGFVSVVNLENLSTITTIPVRKIPHDLAVSQDGRRLYAINGGSDNISVIDTETFEVLKHIPVGVHPYSLVVSPNQPLAYVTHTQGTKIDVLNLEEAIVSEQIDLPVDGRFLGIDISKDGQQLFVANGVQNAILTVSTGSSGELKSLVVARDIPSGVEYSPMELKISPDGTRLYVVNRNGYLSVLKLPTYQLIGTLKVGKDLRDIAFTADGTAYIASFGTDNIVIVKPRT